MKKFISLFLTVAMVVGCLCVSAAYPTTLLTPPTSVGTESDLGNVGNDNSAYAFTYATVNAPDGASFVLLDKDETTGDYLMATNQILVGDTFNFDNDLSNGWQYDPVDETNVAYWVNTHLTSTGGGRALHYIGKIRDYIVEKQWKIEASEAQSLAERTITAKAVLPSYTEYKTYNGKLNSSKAFTNTGWYYVWLRTPSNDMNNTSATNLMLQVSTANSDMGGTGLLARRSPDSGSGTNGIQLFFWVKRDFFKKEKVGNIGTAVKTQLVADYEKSELASLYTEEELVAMGFEADVSAEVSNVKLSTNINAPGGTATVTYDINPADATAAVAYYTCNADGSSPVKLDGVSGTTAKIPSSAGGKYFCAGVTSGSTTVYSAPVQIEAALSEFTSKSDLSAWTLEYNNPDYMFSTSCTNFTVLEEDGNEVVVLADRVDQGISRISKKDQTGDAIKNSFDPAENPYLPTYMNSATFNGGNGLLSNDINGWTATDATGWQSGSVFGIPASMVPYVNTKALWRTEGSTAAGIDEYVFEAAATLPSATEVLKYKDRIGIKGANITNGPSTWIMRTAIGLKTSGYACLLGVYTGNKADDLATNGQGAPRFILRVNKDFFANTKLNVTEAAVGTKTLAAMGSKVKDMLVASFARSEMANANYTEDELTAIGFSDAEPVVSNVVAQGIASVAQTLTASYTYTDPNSSNEDKSKTEYQWYYADTAEGTLNKIDGATSETYKVGADMLGKYIAVGVRAYNTEGVKSGEVKSRVVGPIADRDDIIVTPKSIDNTKAEFVIDNSLAATDMLILYCAYNKTTGALEYFNPATVNVKNGEDTYSVVVNGFTVTDNHIVKAMVWDSFTSMRPYALIEK